MVHFICPVLRKKMGQSLDTFYKNIGTIMRHDSLLKYTIVIITNAIAVLIFGISADGGTVNGVKGTGEAAVVGITAEEGQLLALQRARADAVEQTVGINILGSTLVRNGLLAGEFLKTFSRGFIVAEKVEWLTLPPLIGKTDGPPIFRYGVKIEATVMIPEKKIDPGFRLEASAASSQVSGDIAVITAKVTRKAHVAFFNLRADDRVAMLYPGADITLMPGETFRFPPPESGLILEMATLKGHKRDSEAWMITAVPVQQGREFRFTDYFSADRLYTVPEFFALYSKFAEIAVEKILPYEVRSGEKGTF
ncbi:MAG: hypothetical protein ABIF87_18340 [Pseudomonadota bacterium]